MFYHINYERKMHGNTWNIPEVDTFELSRFDRMLPNKVKLYIHLTFWDNMFCFKILCLRVHLHTQGDAPANFSPPFCQSDVLIFKIVEQFIYVFSWFQCDNWLCRLHLFMFIHVYLSKPEAIEIVASLDIVQGVSISHPVL